MADNLGLRALQEAVDAIGDIWKIMKLTGRDKVRKVVFVVVNAETKTESQWDQLEFVPPFSAMLSNYSTIAIVRYNRETMSILEESFGRWTHQVRAGRCPPGQIAMEPGSCGDIEFYLVDVRFEHLKDKAEAAHLAQLPTSFRLPSEDVDRLRAGARRLLTESKDYQRLLKDLNAWIPSKTNPMGN